MLTTWFQRLASNSLVRRAAEMVGWRFLSSLFGAAGTVWAARCLGADGLGVSGLILSVGGIVVYGVGLQMNSAFVRRFIALPNEEERFELIAELASFRFYFALFVCLIGGIGIALYPMPEMWRWPALACLPFVLFSSLDLGWVLMARQNQHLQQRVVTLRTGLTTIAYFLFFQPGIGAGWDIVVADVVLLICIGWTWWKAVGRFNGVISWRRAHACLPKLKEERVLAASAMVTFGYYSVQMPLVGALATVREMGWVRSSYQFIAPFDRTLRMINGLLYPKLIDWHREDPRNLWRRQVKIVTVSAILCVVAGGLGVLIFPYLLPWVMGEDFRQAALPCALILASRCILVGQESLCSGMWAQYREKSVMLVMAVMIPCMAGLLWWAVPRFGALGAAAALLLAEALATALFFAVTQRANLLEEKSGRGAASGNPKAETIA